MGLEKRVKELERKSLRQAERVELSESDRQALIDATKRLFYYRDPDAPMGGWKDIADDDPEFQKWLLARANGAGEGSN